MLTAPTGPAPGGALGGAAPLRKRRSSGSLKIKATPPGSPSLRDEITPTGDELPPEPEAQNLPKLTGDESMKSYFDRLKDHVNLTRFNIKARLTDDGFYVHKSTFLAGHMTEALLHQPGTVLNETLLFVKVGDQVASFHFTPQDPEPISKLIEMSPATILRPRGPDQNRETFLHIPLPRQDINSHIVVRAVEFAQERKYHPVYNNCVQFVDFMVRVLTRNRVQFAPLLYDAICGHVPNEDHPSLGRLANLTNRSWLSMVSGEALLSEFNAREAKGPLTPRAMSPDAAQGVMSPTSPMCTDPTTPTGEEHGVKRATPSSAAPEDKPQERKSTGGSPWERLGSKGERQSLRKPMSHDDMTHLLSFMDQHWHGVHGHAHTSSSGGDLAKESGSEDAAHFNDAKFWKAELPDLDLPADVIS